MRANANCSADGAEAEEAGDVIGVSCEHYSATAPPGAVSSRNAAANSARV